MSAGDVEKAKREVEMTVHAYFEVGRTKDLTSLSDFYAPRQHFTKYDDLPPFTRQGADEAFIYEQAKFANISDFEYKVDDLRVDIIGYVAIATFYLTYKGVFVNDYSFEGSTVGSRSRVTMVLGKFGERWRIVHQHASPFPDVARKEGPRGP